MGPLTSLLPARVLTQSWATLTHPALWASALQSPHPSVAGLLSMRNIFAKLPVILGAKPWKTPTLQMSHYEPIFPFLFTVLFFWRQSCYVPYIGSELQVLLPLPQVLGLKAQAESTTPWLTVKWQTEMNLGIPGKKGSWFHRSLLLLTKCTKVISSSPPCRVLSTQTGSGQRYKATTQWEHAEPLPSQARHLMKLKNKNLLSSWYW